MHMLTCRRCGGLTPQEASSTCLHCDAPLPRPPRWARRLGVLLGPAGAILLAACYGAPGRYREPQPQPMPEGMTRADRDHDGARGPYECRPGAPPDCADSLARMPPLAPGEVDCDDANASVFPGGPDVEGDVIDGNCDGVDGWADPAKEYAPAGAAPAGGASPPAKIAVPPAAP